jgi:hypothetical protein
MGVLGVSVLLTTMWFDPKASLFRRWWIVTAGMGSLMLVRAAHGAWLGSAALVENVVPLVFSLLLALIVVGLGRVTDRFLPGALERSVAVPDRAVIGTLASGASMFLLQLILLN